MSSRTFHEQVIIRGHVYDYLEANGLTSLRKIAAYVEEKTDMYPSASTISRLVRDYGWNRKKVKWEQVKK